MPVYPSARSSSPILPHVRRWVLRRVRRQGLRSLGRGRRRHRLLTRPRAHALPTARKSPWSRKGRKENDGYVDTPW